jgi:hypothetical protein
LLSQRSQTCHAEGAARTSAQFTLICHARAATYVLTSARGGVAMRFTQLCDASEATAFRPVHAAPPIRPIRSLRQRYSRVETICVCRCALYSARSCRHRRRSDTVVSRRRRSAATPAR